MPQSVSARTVYGEMDLRLDTCICVFVFFVFVHLCTCICLTLCQNWGDEPAFGPSKLKAVVQTIIEDRDIFGKLDIQKHQ